MWLYLQVSRSKFASTVSKGSNIPEVIMLNEAIICYQALVKMLSISVVGCAVNLAGLVMVGRGLYADIVLKMHPYHDGHPLSTSQC